MSEFKVTDKEIDLYKKWQSDWCFFARTVLKVNLDTEQEAILTAIQTKPLVAVKAGTARGKDFVAAVGAMCFMYLTPVFNDKGDLIENTKVALTAPTGRQVENVMYPEVTRLWNRAKIFPGRLVGTEIKTNWDEWFLTGFKADDTNKEAWSGFHAVNTMFIATEATGLSEITCNAIEGNLQGNSRFVLIFNPNTTIGYAARAMSSPRWEKFTLDDLNAPNVIQKKNVIPGQVNYEWVKDKVETWCEIIRKEEFDEGKGDFEWEGGWYRPNDLFRIKVRGMFPEISEDILIPPLWIDLAEKRWLEIKRKRLIEGGERLFGIDVAGMGRDSSVICDRRDHFIYGFDRYQSSGKPDHMKIAGLVINRLKEYGGKAFIDTIGEGAGTYSRLVELGYSSRVFSCKASESGKGLRDITGIYEFVNMRSYLAWAVRDWLNPVNETGACLPPNSFFKRECSEIKYMVLSSGKIQLEPKEEIRKRLGSSTDDFDSLADTFYPNKTTNSIQIQKLLGYLP